jgi:hypothetical protein
MNDLMPSELIEKEILYLRGQKIMFCDLEKRTKYQVSALCIY